MTPFSPVYTYGILCGITSLVLLHLWSLVRFRARTKGLPLPPGPRRLPFVGNLLNVPSSWKPWVGFRHLAQEYGDIVYVEVFGRPMLILGNPDVMLEFLDKRSAISSDRVPSPLIELTGQGYNFAFIPYGQWWRRHRRAFWQQFHPGVVPRYYHHQQSITRDFLAKVLHEPTACQELIRYCLSAVALKAVYNSDMHSLADPRLSVIEDLFVGIREVTASMQLLLDFCPSLQYLPAWTPVIGKFLKKLSASKAPNYHLIETEYADAKARVESGAIDHSVVSNLIQKLDEVRNKEADLMNEEVQIAKGVAGVAMEGEFDLLVTFSTTEGFFVAMALHPEVQRKAQAELDTVVGPQRLPDFGDRDSLVYINAIVKESLRWHNVVPLGVAHKTIEDAELRGYFIPRETMVVPNVWYCVRLIAVATRACMHDHRYYAEPERFNPDRFIRDGRLHADVLDPSNFVFGFGRRKCPGRHFADAGLFILFASVLHVFKIELAKDASGRPVDVKHEQSHGFLSQVTFACITSDALVLTFDRYPENFPCVVRPRSEEAVALIRGSRPREGQ
ncbi:cytochrome P450 [Trametes coccinea BRFM310]|uniref:Cytochrome P450 n=1 Tax=Trametes coccinea (strain BRFM310) TaxID=1353009 RepID=A0A1Y2J231_TRAC3|nr:cytochrome P450 [Trametes coccinea BRFM310]